jgi:hypothetical protein
MSMNFLEWSGVTLWIIIFLVAASIMSILIDDWLKRLKAMRSLKKGEKLKTREPLHLGEPKR